jgi:hypothetical protein
MDREYMIDKFTQLVKLHQKNKIMLYNLMQEYSDARIKGVTPELMPFFEHLEYIVGRIEYDERAMEKELEEADKCYLRLKGRGP